MLKYPLVSKMSLCCFALSILLICLLPLKAQDEMQRLISRKDSYTYVLCYYDEAVEYAIANLESKDPKAKKFAEAIAAKVVNLRLHGQIPKAELKLFSIFQRTASDYYMKFKIAMAQVHLGSNEGQSVIFAEFRDKKLPCDSRAHALQAFIKGNIKPFKKAFEYALEDKPDVAVLGAKGLCLLGDPRGKQWFLRNIDKKTHCRPDNAVLTAIGDLEITEAIPSLKYWLSYANPDDVKSETRAKQTKVAIALARVGSKEGIEFLRVVVSNPKKNAVGYTGCAALCLAGIRDIASIPAIEHALSTKVKIDSLQVAEALLILKSKKSIPLLTQHLDSEDWWGIKSAKLLIKYRVKEAVPALETLLEKELEKKEFLRKQPIHPWIQERLKQKGMGREEYVNEAYRQRFWKRVRLAVGLLELGSKKGKRSIVVLLRDADEASRDRRSWKLLFRAVVAHKITESIPRIIPYLDSKDPLHRRGALLCLRALTGTNLSPQREKWEIWYKNHKSKKPGARLP